MPLAVFFQGFFDYDRPPPLRTRVLFLLFSSDNSPRHCSWWYHEVSPRGPSRFLTISSHANGRNRQAPSPCSASSSFHVRDRRILRLHLPCQPPLLGVQTSSTSRRNSWESRSLLCLKSSPLPFPSILPTACISGVSFSLFTVSPADPPPPSLVITPRRDNDLSVSLPSTYLPPDFLPSRTEDSPSPSSERACEFFFLFCLLCFQSLSCHNLSALLTLVVNLGKRFFPLFEIDETPSPPSPLLLPRSNVGLNEPPVFLLFSAFETPSSNSGKK